MNKRIFVVFLIVFLVFSTIMPAFGAETFSIDISKLSGAKKGNATTHSGRPTVVELGYPEDTYVAEFNRNTVKSMQNALIEAKKTLNIDAITVVYDEDGETVKEVSIDLTDYERIEITYATKEGFVAVEGDKCAAIGLKSSGTTFGVIPNQRNDEGLVVIAEITDAEITNPDATGIKRTERKVVMDISDLTYNGLLVLHTYNVSNPDLDSIVISEVKFIAKTQPTTEPETETNPQTGDIGLASLAGILVSTVLFKKRKTK